MQFQEFVDKKERESRKHLDLVKRVLEKGGFEVVDQLKSGGDPHLFIKNPADFNLPFEGVRMYEIGGEVAYRIQNRQDTEPYGRAYAVPVEKMFEDLLGEDDMDDQKKGEEIVQAIVQELKEFFERSAKAEKENPIIDPMGSVKMRSTGTDYANQVYDIKNR